MSFKICTGCQEAWESRIDFILSPDVHLDGFQPAFSEPEKGLFLFHHTKCKTTMGIQVFSFSDLYKGPHYSKSKMGFFDCPGKCLSIADLSRCDIKCSMAHIREIMQIILQLKAGQKHKSSDILS